MHYVEDLVEATQAFVLPAHEDEKMVGCSHTDRFMKEPLDVVGEHIDYFICVERRKWDVGYSNFNRDPIYDIEGGFRVDNDKLIPSECLSTFLYGLDVSQHDDDMVTDLFRPPKDEWLQHTYVDF